MSRASQHRARTAPERWVIVQCCHLPHFFFAARKLRQQLGQQPLEAILVRHPQVDEFLSQFGDFERVFSLDAVKRAWDPKAPTASDERPLNLVFPLWTRGYGRFKRILAQLPHTQLWETDYEGQLSPLSRGRLVRSAWQALQEATPEFVEYLQRFPHRPSGQKVLLLHSAPPELIKESRSTWQQHLPAGAQVQELKSGRLWSNWRRLRSDRPDAAVVFYSGASGYWKLKLLPLLLRLRQVLVINENGDAFYLSRRSLIRFLYQRFRHGVTSPRPPAALFIQTEDRRHSEFALLRLRRQILTPGWKLAVLCPQAESSHFETLPGVDQVIGYSSRQSEIWRIRREISYLSPDIVSAVCSGRPIFRKQKLLFLSMLRCRQLVFNAGLECYWLSPKTLPRLFRKEPLRFPEPRPEPAARSESLLIQTEDEKITAESIRLLASEKVSGGRPVAVLCSAQQRRTFAGLPQVERVYVYQTGSPLQNLKLLRRLWRQPRDIVAAIYSGRPIFRIQKLLLFLLPAQNRLVFNENLDCFYLRRRQFLSLFRRPAWVLVDGRFSWLKIWGLQLCKGLLYLPRFAYLLGWLTWQKLLRAHRLLQQDQGTG